MDQGVWRVTILLLKVLPQPAQFEFDGTTLRSGGRLGLPAQTDAEDKTRPRVHDTIASDHYEAMQVNALARAQVSGSNRLVKIAPEIRHDDDLAPNVQYPMGGGFLQWKLKAPGLPFLVAAHISGTGIATTPKGTFALNSGHASDDYSARAALQAELQCA